jgi:signal peptidase I
MKRVAAFPGETVQINREGQLVIDGQIMKLPPSLHLKYLGFGNVIAGNSFVCTDGYYVLGDDTKDSDDSRFNGPVTSDRIVGRAWLIIKPWSRIGSVNP